MSYPPSSAPLSRSRVAHLSASPPGPNVVQTMC